MKRKIRFWKKTKLYFKFLLEREGYGLEACCDFCNSSKIEKISGENNKINENRSEFIAEYLCIDCGSKGSIYEVWTKLE